MELQQIIDRYQIAFNTIYRSVNTTIKEHVHDDITTDQFSILQHIHRQHASTSTEIANTFGVGKSAITALVNRLFEKDLIIRERDQKDRRIVYLSLTEKGTELVKQTQAEVYRFISDKLSNFSENDVEAFLNALEKLANLMENN